MATNDKIFSGRSIGRAVE